VKKYFGTATAMPRMAANAACSQGRQLPVPTGSSMHVCGLMAPKPKECHDAQELSYSFTNNHIFEKKWGKVAQSGGKLVTLKSQYT
jgi:hypothetical protein